MTMIVKCKECGGTDVQVASWVNPNTGEVGDDYGSWDESDTKYCYTCKEHVRLEVVEEELPPKLKSKTILITFEDGSVLEQDVEETSPLYERDSWSIHADPVHPKDDCRHACDMRGTVACRVGCRFYGVYPTEQQAQEVRRG